MKRMETDSAHPNEKQGQRHSQEDTAYNLRQAVAAAADVPALCSALNQLDAFLGKDHEEIATIPVFSSEPDVDWSEFADEPVSCDETYVLFKENSTGRYYYMDRSEVERAS